MGSYPLKNTPLFSKERLEKAREFRFYKENPQTGRIFKGNQHTKVFDTKNSEPRLIN